MMHSLADCMYMEQHIVMRPCRVLGSRMTAQNHTEHKLHVMCRTGCLKLAN